MLHSNLVKDNFFLITMRLIAFFYNVWKSRIHPLSLPLPKFSKDKHRIAFGSYVKPLVHSGYKLMVHSTA